MIIRIIKMIHKIVSPVLFLAVLVVGGCIVVQPDKNIMEINDLPPDHAALFVVVSLDISSAEMLEVNLNDEYSIILHANSINRVYLPENWYTMQLTRLPQQPENAEIRYRFSAGEINRFTLLERTITDSSASDFGENTYLLAPSTRDGFQQLLLQGEYPLVNVIPQKVSGR